MVYGFVSGALPPLFPPLRGGNQWTHPAVIGRLGRGLPNPDGAVGGATVLCGQGTGSADEVIEVAPELESGGTGLVDVEDGR